MKMSKRPYMKTTKKQIVAWGIRNIDECGYGVDASTMHSHCWRCGYERHTEKCHVVPHSLGGEDKPYNYRLFCHDCHLEQPNVNDFKATDEWVRRTCVPTYNTFWKHRENFLRTYFKTTYHWGEKINQETAKWIINKFIEDNRMDLLFTDINQVLNCVLSMTPPQWMLEKLYKEMEVT
tara:strand:+ start:518 stop:1051 length:534 start_codon:yes stop_codon:yes gene_type:complete